MSKKTIAIFLLLIVCNSNAQVGIGTTIPNNSAALDITDTAKGILIPRMTFNQKSLIFQPAEGLMIYQLDDEKGFYFYNGTNWISINSNNTGNCGKQTIVLSDDVTDQEAQQIIADNFGTNTQEIQILGCTNLTNVDLSMVTTAIKIEIAENNVLHTVNLQNLSRCDGAFLINNCPSLVNLNVSSLTRIVGEFYCYTTALTELNFPQLIRAKWFNFSHNNFLSSIALPVISSVKQLSFYDCNLTAISCPNLTVIENLSITSNANLSSISLPSLTDLGDSYGTNSIQDCPNLTSIILGSLDHFNCQSITINNNRLPSSQVNYLLNKFVSISPSITNKGISIKNNPPAAPTGQGIIDKGILISNGNIVTTD